MSAENIDDRLLTYSEELHLRGVIVEKINNWPYTAPLTGAVLEVLCGEFLGYGSQAELYEMLGWDADGSAPRKGEIVWGGV